MARTSVKTSTAPEQDHPDARILLCTPRQARTLHRLVASYNVQGETHDSPSFRPEADLEATLLRLAAAE